MLMWQILLGSASHVCLIDHKNHPKEVNAQRSSIQAKKKNNFSSTAKASLNYSKSD